MFSGGQDFAVSWGAVGVRLGLVETTRPVSWECVRAKRAHLPRRGARTLAPGVQQRRLAQRVLLVELREVAAVELLARVLVVQRRVLVEGDGVLVGVRWVSELLGVPVGTVRAWLGKGRGPCWYKVGNNVRFRRGEVVGWVECGWRGELPGGWVPNVLRVNPHKLV